MTDNQMTLPNGKVITFNEQQVEAIQKIRKWLKDKNKTFFTLAGHAGTGKTSIIKKILDEYRWGVVVSAPTHKAKKKIIEATDIEGCTLHSILGLRADVALEAYNPNDPTFSPIAPPRIGDYSLLILDEVSMVNKSLFELIKEKVINCNTKVLFMGDSAQLPPVNEDITPAFNDESIERFELTIIERQEIDNPLLPIFVILRNNLNCLNVPISRKTNISESGKGIVFILDKKEFRKIVIEKFKSNEFKKDSDYCKGLAWKNDTVVASNKIVRDEIFGENADIVEVGDILMGYRTVTNERQNYNIIVNSADYHVMNKSKIEKNAYDITGFRVKLREDLPRKKFSYADVFIINSNDYDNLHLYAEMHDFFRDAAKLNKKKWKDYYEFRRSNLLMVTIDKHRNGLYRNSRDTIQKDIDSGFFITIHKAQGSTYQNVMVNEIDLNLNQNIVERNKLRYVALSRPTTCAYVLSSKLDR
jgi:exodeoxyribonuclease-5